MVGWHHQCNGYEFEETLGVGDGQGSLVCCSPWGHKELDMTEQLNNNNITFLILNSVILHSKHCYTLIIHRRAFFLKD